MNERQELINTLRRCDATMEESSKAYLEYVDARDMANSAFCRYANKFGIRDALRARREAEGNGNEQP